MSDKGAGKFTPGPWFVEDDTDIYSSGDGCELLATAYPMKRDGIYDSWKANVRLIAAAPELLQALELVLESDPIRHILKLNHRYESGCTCEGCQIESAIKKALGESA